MATKLTVLAALLTHLFSTSYDQLFRAYASGITNITDVPNPNPTGNFTRGVLLNSNVIRKGAGYKELEYELYLEANTESILDTVITELEAYSSDSRKLINALIAGFSDIEFEYTDLTSLLNDYICSYQILTLPIDMEGNSAGDVLEIYKFADNLEHEYINGVLTTEHEAYTPTKLQSYNTDVTMFEALFQFRAGAMFSLPLGTDYAYLDKLTMLLNFQVDESEPDDLPFNKLFDIYVFYSADQLDFSDIAVIKSSYNHFLTLSSTVKGFSFTTEESEQTLTLDITPNNLYLNIMIMPQDAAFLIKFGADYQSKFTLEYMDFAYSLFPFYVDIIEKERAYDNSAIIKILARYEQ
jgi:hypothetical protein